MTLIQDLTHALDGLAGHAGPSPQTISVSQAQPAVLVAVEVSAADRLSCAVREIRLDVPSVAQQGFSALQAWAAALSERVTYLLEDIGPLEFDPDNGQVLLRSNQPDSRDPSRKAFYEVLLATRTDGTFSLRRYESLGQAGRQPVDMQLTHEVLRRLVTDLIETLPHAA